MREIQIRKEDVQLILNDEGIKLNPLGVETLLRTGAKIYKTKSRKDKRVTEYFLFGCASDDKDIRPYLSVIGQEDLLNMN